MNARVLSEILCTGFEHLIMDQVFTASTDLQGEKKFITIVCTTASCIM
ncbi:hypothetical protein AFGD_001675 [Aspergillus flavus]|nr:hypothetical protein NYO67_5715 [Aspergillus flavus]RAQ53330.1 hypothetical protein AFGD_001675 [Aspergillus flavus]